MYILVTLLSAIFLGAYNVFKKSSLKKSNVFEVLFFYCLCGFTLSLIFVSSAFSLSFVDILFIFGKSSIIAVSWYLTIKGMEKLDVGIVSAFSLVNTVLVVFGSSLFFSEQLTWVHFVSLLIIGIGTYLIALIDRNQTSKSERKNHYWYMLVLLLANVFSACSGLLDKYLINYRNCNPNGMLVWFLFFNSLIYGVIYFAKCKKIEFKKLKENYFLICTGAAIALADMTYFFAITMDGAQLSIISIARKSSIVIATVLASIFLKEKKLIYKLGVLFIMLIGVALPIIF